MYIPLISPSKLLVTFFLLANSFGFAYACSPPPRILLSVEEHVQNSSNIFDGVVTEITDKYLTIKVEQYFKGAGANNVKIAYGKGRATCSDRFKVNQRALFFTKGKTDEMLNPVYSHTLKAGSAYTMNESNFRHMATIKECMAIYEGGILTTPCVIHQETQNIYKARLESTGNLTFSVTHVDLANSPSKNAECMAVYQGGQLTVPCIAHQDSQKIYHAQLEPVTSSTNLQFSVGSTKTVTNIITAPIQPTPTAQQTSHFDHGVIGTVPNQWKSGITGNGVANWELVEDLSAPSSPLVLKQSGDGNFPWCIKENSALTDGFISVKFKAISGEIDQAAGLVWRWKDANNYYVARANALEDNISIYYVKDGQRTTIQYETVPSDLPVKRGIWQTLRVDFKDNHFMVSFEGVTIVDIKDDHIKGEGAVGMWTKEDSVISFDDFTYGQ